MARRWYSRRRCWLLAPSLRSQTVNVVQRRHHQRCTRRLHLQPIAMPDAAGSAAPRQLSGCGAVPDLVWDLPFASLLGADFSFYSYGPEHPAMTKQCYSSAWAEQPGWIYLNFRSRLSVLIQFNLLYLVIHYYHVFINRSGRRWSS